MSITVVVVGATGNVGREILNILFDRKFPVKNIAALASRKSLGKEVSYGVQNIRVEEIKIFELSRFPFISIIAII